MNQKRLERFWNLHRAYMMSLLTDEADEGVAQEISDLMSQLLTMVPSECNGNPCIGYIALNASKHVFGSTRICTGDIFVVIAHRECVLITQDLNAKVPEHSLFTEPMTHRLLLPLFRAHDLNVAVGRCCEGVRVRFEGLIEKGELSWR